MNKYCLCIYILYINYEINILFTFRPLQPGKGIIYIYISLVSWTTLVHTSQGEENQFLWRRACFKECVACRFSSRGQPATEKCENKGLALIHATNCVEYVKSVFRVFCGHYINVYTRFSMFHREFFNSIIDKHQHKHFFIPDSNRTQSNALHHKGHHVHPLHVLLPQHRNWSSGILNSVFFKNLLKILNF